VRARLGIAVVTASLAALAPGTPASATFPGSDGKIGVSAFDDTIRTVNPDGTGETVLTPVAFGAQWSPDGTRIAFTRRQPPGCTASCAYSIWLMNADGSETQGLFVP
jgi:WD40-like Beta Propeller Repeat